MCNESCIIFGAKHLTKELVQGKRILEVGSYAMNGSLRALLETWSPKEYMGVDIKEGPGVDFLCQAEDILDKFGKGRFDIVISTELLEHVRDWRKVITNLKEVCVPNGMILITTRSYGFGYHAHPSDFWRYEIDDMRFIFSDCELLALEKDPQEPGVYIFVKKPKKFIPIDLSFHLLYSIVADRRVKELSEEDFTTFSFKKKVFKAKLKTLFFDVGRFVFSKL